jgi:hypothetical protein
MWWEQRVQPPAPGHSSLETMTQQDYQTQLVSDAFWSPGTHVGLNYRLASALRAAATTLNNDGKQLQKLADSIQNGYQ